MAERRRGIVEVSEARLKINWFSPLPPLETDIGHYSVRVLPALAARCDITLWTVQKNWNPAIEDIAPVRRWDPAHPVWRDLNDADLNVYHIGNNAQYHAAILQLALNVPGLVVLHDTRLQHLAINCLSQPAYRRAMGDIYGPEGMSAAKAVADGTLSVEAVSERFPLGTFCLDRALGGLVHNKREREILAGQTDLPLFDLPLPYAAGSVPAASVRSGPVRVVQFGYIHSNRRVDKVLDALASLTNKQDYRLDIYGQVWDRDLVEGWIKERGLESIVSLHGFVSEAELDAAIRDAELAINLRWPNMGEASGSQLRIWNQGRPALVTNAGWYAGLPPDTVFFVDPSSDSADIARHLRALKLHPETYRQSGLRGRALLESAHGPDAYAASFLDCAAKALAYDAGSARLVGESLGVRLMDWPQGTALPGDFEDLARQLMHRGEM